MKHRIYLDNAATTPVDQRVVDVMLPFFLDKYGNASSLHAFGTEAKEILERSRAQIAGTLGNISPSELYFTSGGTESNNLALKGIAFANRHKGNHIIVSSIEHDCILNTCRWLEQQGFSISILPVDGNGIVKLRSLEGMIIPGTILVSVMYANNELGSIQPVEEIGKICRHYQVPFHSDACQAYGKIPLDTVKDNIDLLTINAHKIYGPKGVGALYVRSGIPVDPLLHGGGQEMGLRSSTENIPGIAGFAKAALLCMEEMKAEAGRQAVLKEKLMTFLYSSYENVYINGSEEFCLPGYLNFSIHGLEGETIRLLLLLDELGIAVSAGSACSSNNLNHAASHVLQAIGRNPFEARGAVRVSMGRFTTEKDIEFFISALQENIGTLSAIFFS